MKILELILRIILRLIEALSSKPAEVPPLDNPSSPKAEDPGSISPQSTSRNSNGNSIDPTVIESKSLRTYNNETRDLISRIMAAHRATHEADLNEIFRLRKEVCNLQEELILAKANVHGKNNIKDVNSTQTLQGTDDVESVDSKEHDSEE